MSRGATIFGLLGGATKQPALAGHHHRAHDPDARELLRHWLDLPRAPVARPKALALRELSRLLGRLYLIVIRLDVVVIHGFMVV